MEKTPEESLVAEIKKKAFGKPPDAAIIAPKGKKSQKTDEKIGAGEVRKQAFAEGKKAGLEEGGRLGYERGYKKGNLEGRQEGRKEGAAQTYPIAFSEGKIEGVKKLVISIEKKMAQADGYSSREDWLKERQVPAYWIGALIENWEPPLPLSKREGERYER